jgi:ABC-type branched-subunit amino acid transport system permease subunit
LNDERATYWGRLADFVLSGASCGFGGAVLAVFYGFIQGDLYSWVTSVTFLGIALIGGRYLLSTAIAGTALYFIIQQALSSYVPIPQLHTLVGPGLILLALLVYVGPTKLLGSKKVRS